MFGGILVPLDGGAFDRAGVAARGKGLLLFSDLLGGIETDLSQEFVRHCELRVRRDRFPEAGDGFGLRYVIDIQRQSSGKAADFAAGAAPIAGEGKLKARSAENTEKRTALMGVVLVVLIITQFPFSR